MSKREAKRWACGLVAADIIANIANGCYDLGQLDQAGQEYQQKVAALSELAAELGRRGDDA